MKIAIIRTSCSYADIQTYNSQGLGFGLALIKRGISVDFYSRFKNIEKSLLYKDIRGAQLRLIPIRGFSIKEITFYPSLLRKDLLSSYDVVQVHEESQLMTPLILQKAHKFGVKTILVQGMYKPYTGIAGLYQRFLHFLCIKSMKQNTDFVFSKTELARKFLQGFGFKDVELLPVGYFKREMESFKLDSFITFKKTYKKLLLYVGILNDRRDISFILRTFLELRKNDNDIGLVIVGNGPNKSKLLKEARDLRILSHILFIDCVSNNKIIDLMKSCDVFLLPTKYEIFGMVILEALSAGLAVISTKTAGPLQILSNKKMGQCLPLLIDRWVGAIKYYTYTNSRSVIDDRINYIKCNYNWDNIAKGYIAKILNEDEK